MMNWSTSHQKDKEIEARPDGGPGTIWAVARGDINFWVCDSYRLKLIEELHVFSLFNRLHLRACHVDNHTLREKSFRLVERRVECAPKLGQKHEGQFIQRAAFPSFET
jgi:hypothetical protein